MPSLYVCNYSLYDEAVRLRASCYVHRGVSHLHYRNQSLRRVPEALGEALKTLGKGFAECNTRQTVHRQRLLCRVLFLGHSAKMFAECQGALGKKKRSYDAG
jgi:hypothetical protein